LTRGPKQQTLPVPRNRAGDVVLDGRITPPSYQQGARIETSISDGKQAPPFRLDRQLPSKEAASALYFNLPINKVYKGLIS
jgi:hypothetical protein